MESNKKIMQVEVEVKHIETNFGSCGLSSFKDFAVFKIWPNFPFGPWTIAHECQKIESNRIS